MDTPDDPQAASLEPTPRPPLPPAFADDTRMRELVYHSLVRGLCVAIPLPFLDDWVIERVRRRAAARQFGDYGVELRAAEMAVLLHGAAGQPGCWRSCLVMPLKVAFKIIVWPIRRIVGMVLFVFTLRRMVNEATSQFAEAAALACLLDDPAILPSYATAPAATADLLHRAIARTRATTDASVLRGIYARSLGGGRQVVRSAAGALRSRARRLWKARASTPTDDAPDMGATLDAEAPGFAGLLHHLGAAIREHPEYLASVQAAALAALAAERDAAAQREAAATKALGE